MEWLNDAIDVAEYARLYKTYKEIAESKVLVSFTQGKGSYTATWQNSGYSTTLHGKPAKLKAWMAAKVAEEATAFDAMSVHGLP